MKVVKHMAEEGQIAVRNLRRGARHELEALEKDGDLSEDELERAEKELDKLTHAHEAEIDRPSRPRKTSCSRTDGFRQALPRPRTGRRRAV